MRLNFDECDDVIEIHPQDEDFKDGFEGRILISALHGGGYYNKDYKYQKKDAEVEIELLLPLSQLNETVYFRIVEEDQDDLSSYELDSNGNEDTEPNDNIGGKGTLSSESDIADQRKYTGRGITKAKASVILSINNIFR